MSTGQGIRLPLPRSTPATHRVHGPSALGSDLRRFWSLTFTLARTEFKLRFYGSALGYVWTLMKPLLLFGVLWVFFTKVGHVNDGKKPGEKYYGAQLLGSIVLFTFFIEGTTNAVRSVVDRENLVRKIHFPRLVIPLSVVLLGLFNLALNLIVVAIFALSAGVRPMLSWAELPLIVLALVVFATGMAMLLSALFVHFRDIQPIWEVFAQALFYASPVIISIQTVQAKLSTTLLHLYMLNPLAVIFQQFRHAMITHATPAAGQVLGSWSALFGALAIVVAIFIAGFLVFNRAAARIAENL
ncbi:MAG TPA: ABC transporter permease [Solirubrobacteraceae bacterium]|jgi:ABC-2 type transport system permease protein|nr:ABC transporter permease [Solirubrobacteraceae bacterium]